MKCPSCENNMPIKSTRNKNYYVYRLRKCFRCNVAIKTYELDANLLTGLIHIDLAITNYLKQLNRLANMMDKIKSKPAIEVKTTDELFSDLMGDNNFGDDQ